MILHHRSLDGPDRAQKVPCISMVPAYKFQVPCMADPDYVMIDEGDGNLGDDYHRERRIITNTIMVVITLW